jgi:hypothetical protein
MLTSVTVFWAGSIFSADGIDVGHIEVAVLDHLACC